MGRGVRRFGILGWALSMAFVGVAIAQATLGLTAYYKLDDTASPAVDAASGFDGTWVGGVTSSTDVPTPGGSINFTRSMTFTAAAAADYIDLPSNATMDTINEGSYTIAAWVKPLSMPTTGTPDAQYGIIMKTGWHEGLTFDDAGHFGMYHWTGAIPTPTNYASSDWPGPALATGAWYHVAGIVDLTAMEVRCYVNGTQYGASTAIPGGTTATSYGTNPWHIGIGDPTPASAYRFQMDGRIDDVRFYNRALTNAEIQTLAAGNTVGDPPPPAPPPPAAGPHLGTRHESKNLAHRCGCSRIEGPGAALPLAAGLAIAIAFLRRRGTRA